MLLPIPSLQMGEWRCLSEISFVRLWGTGDLAKVPVYTMEKMVPAHELLMTDKVWLCILCDTHTQEAEGNKLRMRGDADDVIHVSGSSLSNAGSSFLFGRSVVPDSLRLHGLQYARLPCPPPTPGACSNSWPSSWWCHPTISVIPFSSCLQSFPALGPFPRSQFFTSGGQSIGVSPSASILPMNIQDWFPLGWTGWIALLSRGLSRVFSNTTVQNHQFFSSQLSLWSSSHIHTWLLEKP